MWIYESPDWPNFVWSDEVLIDKLAEVRHLQGRLLGRMDGLGFDLQREASLATLTSDVVKSSAIEGEHLPLEEVRSSIARRLGMDIAGLAPVSRNVEGIVDIMLDATQQYAQPLTAERLFDWHAALFPTGRSGMHRIIVGHWRNDDNGPMQVVSGPVGRETVHFAAPVADQVADEMTHFIHWFNTEHAMDAVIKAGIAHLWFVTIHPFDDGNGRIGRAIADMALARADGTTQRFYSLSTQIEAERKAYYQHLEKQQRASTDITDWLSWFLSCLGSAIANAEKALSHILFKTQLWERINAIRGAAPVSERQRRIINRLLEPDFQGHMNTSKYAKLAKCSNDTALRDIQQLTTRGILIQNPGGGRSTSYRLANHDELSAIQ